MACNSRGEVCPAIIETYNTDVTNGISRGRARKDSKPKSVCYRANRVSCSSPKRLHIDRILAYRSCGKVRGGRSYTPTRRAEAGDRVGNIVIDDFKIAVGYGIITKVCRKLAIVRRDWGNRLSNNVKRNESSNGATVRPSHLSRNINLHLAPPLATIVPWDTTPLVIQDVIPDDRIRREQCHLSIWVIRLNAIPIQGIKGILD